jgi:hypothetical protein
LPKIARRSSVAKSGQNLNQSTSATSHPLYLVGLFGSNDTEAVARLITVAAGTGTRSVGCATDAGGYAPINRCAAATLEVSELRHVIAESAGPVAALPSKFPPSLITGERRQRGGIRGRSVPYFVVLIIAETAATSNRRMVPSVIRSRRRAGRQTVSAKSGSEGWRRETDHGDQHNDGEP